MWIRYVFQALIISWMIFRRDGTINGFKSNALGLELLRGLLMLLVTLLAFVSLGDLPVGSYTSINMLSPLLMTMLAARTLGESVSTTRIMLAGISFIGMLLIARPGGNVKPSALVAPLVMVGFNCAFQLLSSRLAREDDAMVVQFYSGWIGTILPIPFLASYWSPITDTNMVIGLVLMGLSGTAGHLLMSMAFERAPAATLGPYFYAQIGFAVLGDLLLFAITPDFYAVTGMGMIAACGVVGALLTMSESRGKVLPT